ncbi:MAG TPA: ChaN family lipoprotein [Methylomirabilota bacterium]|nr:ChaN family lipoprotein [Methylomirabilota bacterium]
MWRLAGSLLAVVLLILPGCAAPAAVDLGAWLAPVGREHPLTGRIWETRRGRFVTSDQVVAGLAGARYVLLGERHDNPDHHRVQAALLRALIGAGRRPAVAFEMFTADDAPAIGRHLAAAPRDAAGLGEAVNWKRSGWPDWAHYQPIAQAALDAGLPVVAANLAPATARALARGQRASLPDGLAARYGLEQPLPDGAQGALTAEIDRAHCGHIPADRLEGMVLAQRARDAMLADSLLAGERDGAVLIAGAGHVRGDRGVPLYLRARAPGATIATLAPLEVHEAWTKPEQYGETFGGGRLPFDWVWFTPRMDDGRGDPCARFKRPPQPPRS